MLWRSISGVMEALLGGYELPKADSMVSIYGSQTGEDTHFIKVHLVVCDVRFGITVV